MPVHTVPIDDAIEEMRRLERQGEKVLRIVPVGDQAEIITATKRESR